jgi:hypothetical protein
MVPGLTRDHGNTTTTKYNNLWQTDLGLRQFSHHKEKEIFMKITRNIGFLLLSIWLILTGLVAFVPAISGLGVILALLAIAAGVFILIGR